MERSNTDYDNARTRREDRHALPPFQVVLGQSHVYLVPLCDPSSHYIDFGGSISQSVSKSKAGSVHWEWEPATLQSYNRDHGIQSSECNQDLIMYHVFVSQSSLDLTSSSFRDLMRRAAGAHENDLLHMETGEI